ncbi:MAG: cytochrome c, partial [Candidatus Latescibacteria bacterium]|nr:cytochrome c [Candidatus Latescibacterota bacterium]
TATGLTCFHCHADFNEKKTPDGQVRPGHSLFNAGFRTLFHKWDRSKTPYLVDAIQTCTQRWITEREDEGTDGLEPARHHLRQLVAYLQSEALVQESKAKPIEPIWIDKLPVDRTLKAGDSSLGARVFRRSCQNCHLREGDGPAPSLVRNGYSRYQIAKKIRGIKNPGLDGLVMPSFPLDRLSDRELINVCAYVFQM